MSPALWLAPATRARVERVAARGFLLTPLLFMACQGATVGEGGSDAGLTGGTSPGGGGSATGGSSGSGGSSASGGSSGSSGSGGNAGGTVGPGPHGSLPTGYCCTADEECRYRTCLDVGGVKLCSDPCSQDDTCNSAPNMVCDKSQSQCVPKGAPSCIPADQWTNGTGKIGSCCIATGDGHAGQECEGNLCFAFGPISNPFICIQACDKPADCPPKYQCNTFEHFCWPIAETYDCQ